MASSIVITIKSEVSQADLQRLLELPTNANREGILAVAGHIREYASGSQRGIVSVQTASAAPVAASATLTLTSAIATDAVTIGAVTLTASSTPANENQFEIDGASDTLDAASLAACINAHSVLSKVVVASSAEAVVTVAALQKGLVGNQVPISSADATIVASSSFLAGGTGGAAAAGKVYNAGIA